MQHKFVLTPDASKHDHLKGTWELDLSVYVGDWYNHNTGLYECILAHVSAADSEPGSGANFGTYWQLVTGIGTPFGDIIWEGAWSAETTYTSSDGVTFGGVAYVSIQDGNLNHQPPNVTWWVPLGSDPSLFVRHSLATALSDFLVASGAGVFVKKTLAEVKTILGLGSAAYTESSTYAVAAKGVTNGDSHDHVGGDGGQVDHVNLANKGTNTHSTIDTHLGSTSNPHSVTAAQAGAAPSAQGVTNGNSHDHAGGDGAQIDHGGLGGLGDPDHSAYIPHSLATAASDFLVASGAGVFIKKTLAETKTILGVGASSGKGFLTLGMAGSGADYECDAVDDHVTFQSALTAAAAAGQDVHVFNGNYTFGSTGTITIPFMTGLIGESRPDFGDRTYDANLKTVVAINIVSTSANPILLKSGCTVENIYFRYPNQSLVSPIVYPSTIVLDPAGNWGTSGILLRWLCSGLAYNFIDIFDADGSPAEIVIDHIRGSAMHTCIHIENSGHVIGLIDCQFVPGFDGTGLDSTALQNYLADHMIGFDIGLNLAGYCFECKIWCALTGFNITSPGIALIDCMGDGCQYPLVIDANSIPVIGGGYNAVRVHNGVGEWTDGLHCIHIKEGHSGNRIFGTSLSAASCNIKFYAGSCDNIFTDNMTWAGNRSGTSLCAGIWDEGERNICSSNIINCLEKTNVFGVYFKNTLDSRYRDNDIIYNVSGLYSYNGSYGRIMVDGSSTNAGVPGVAGAWASVAYPGIIVYDTVGGHTYQHLNGAWRKLDVETVMAKADRNTDQAIPDLEVTGVVCNNELIDTHAAFNPATGIFTVPIAGYYRLTQLWRIKSIAWGAGDELSCPVLVNGSEAGKTYGCNMEAAHTGVHHFGGSYVTNWLAVGATIQPAIWSRWDITIDGVAFPTFNYVSIERIP